MSRRFVLVALALCLLMPAVPAKAVRMEMPYEGPAITSYRGLEDCADPVGSKGTVCVDVAPGADELAMRVSDRSGLAVGGVWYAHDATGGLVGMGVFCDALTLALPEGADTVVFRLDATGQTRCYDAGQLGAGPATKGVLALRLR